MFLASWTKATCSRYLKIADALDASPKAMAVMRVWQYQYGRDCLLDDYSHMRAAVTAAPKPDELVGAG